MAIGATTGALSGALSDIGVDDGFIKEIGSTIEPGNSALFLLVREAKLDKLIDEIKTFNPKILRTSLSKDDEDKLRETFGSD